jgi:hypothetical protein
MTRMRRIITDKTKKICFDPLDPRHPVRHAARRRGSVSGLSAGRL